MNESCASTTRVEVLEFALREDLGLALRRSPARRRDRRRAARSPRSRARARSGPRCGRAPRRSTFTATRCFGGCRQAESTRRACAARGRRRRSLALDEHHHALARDGIERHHAREAAGLAVVPDDGVAVARRDVPRERPCAATALRPVGSRASPRASTPPPAASCAGSTAAFRYFAMSDGVERRPPAPASASSRHGGTAAQLHVVSGREAICAARARARSPCRSCASGPSTRSRSTFS